MNLYETVKGRVTPQMAAERYDLPVNRSGMACCPFHNDRTPSMKLYPDHFHCFGCGQTGDVIDLTAQLTGQNARDAAGRLATDFGIPMQTGEDTAPRPAKEIPYHLTRQFRESERLCFSVLTDYLHLLRGWKVRCAPNAPDESLDDRFVEACQMECHMFIVPDTQEAIVSQAQWDRVQELRKNKRRPVKAERQGLFAGLVYCADCGSKLHFATCKGFEGKQDHYRCFKYKSGRGECSAHYIREDVLRELVLERIQAVNAYIRSDVEGFQEERLHYRRADQERDIREDQKRMEQAKKRLATLDVVMSRLYEDYALGEISKEKYKKMTSDYEAEQERLKLEIETTEEWVEQRQAMGDDLDAFIALTKKYVDVTELTQTIVNEYIKKIIIHAPDKSGGKRRQKVEIFFNFVDEVEIPVLAEPMIAESTLGRKKTA